MADPKPDLTRAGTMQVTAQEGIDYLHAAGKDKLLEAQGLVDAVEDDKPAVPRDSTMAVTAKEGVRFVEEMGSVDEDALTRHQQKQIAELQKETVVAAEESPKKPVLSKCRTMADTAQEGVRFIDGSIDEDALTRQQQKKIAELQKQEAADASRKAVLSKSRTMTDTAKEGVRFLGSQVYVDPDAHTRGQQKQLNEMKSQPAQKRKPRLSKQGTMAGTRKEGETFLGEVGKPDEDALTRGQQRKLDEIQNETEPSPKKPRLSKDNTMLETAKEAHAYIIGDDKLGETRSETKAKNAKPVTPKRTATMAATMEEAKYVLEGEDVDVSEGRKTRSRGKPNEKTPPVKRQGTMQSTAKEGEEFLSRGQDDDDDDDDEVEEVDDDGSDEENEDDS